MRFMPSCLLWPETQTLFAALGAAHVRLVGGCVRDALLERPVQDVDAATVLLPEEVMAKGAENDLKAIPTGLAHGTVTLVIGKRTFEVTTLRRDVATDGRHAVVCYTDDWQQDAARRDFTMNALYCDADGHITDYFGGVEDAREGRVRFIGDASRRIQEDALRILRFFRFSARYGRGGVDAEGLAACVAQKAKISELSGERICQEMLKLLMATRAAEMIECMQAQGIVEFALGCTVSTSSLTALTGLWAQVELELDGVLALAALLRSSPEPLAHALWVKERWKLSNVQWKRLQRLCAEGLPELASERECKRLIRQWGAQVVCDLAILLVAEGRADVQRFLAVKALARAWEVPVFPVTGEDLKRVAGLKEGKALGEALTTLEALWEANDYQMSRDELLQSLRQ